MRREEDATLRGLPYLIGGQPDDTTILFGPATAEEFPDWLKGRAAKERAQMRKYLRKQAIRLAKREKGARLTTEEMEIVLNALNEMIQGQIAR